MINNFYVSRIAAIWIWSMHRKVKSVVVLKCSPTLQVLLFISQVLASSFFHFFFFVRVFSFDFSRAFDSIPQAIVCDKLASLNINPYVINWIVSFLSNRKQRVVVDGFVTKWGVPQGTVLGPILFSIMVNDVTPVYPERNLLVKYADDLTLSATISADQDHSSIEVNSIENWEG